MIKKFAGLVGQKKFTFSCQRNGTVKVNAVNIHCYKSNKVLKR